ncbi:hypothetical protein AB6A40_010294 [Gnathostoma spinigerum]|uniref:Cytochrome b561 domain-containing protein n=1 Tax=Gnathostoma spinigerum TaxID=75299 RepID=A0ABD6EUD3_9BILA
MVVIFMVIALKAVWDSHDYHMKDGVLDPLPNLYSLHSWIGITVVVFYCLQYASGFSTFFFPGLSIPMRHFVMPFHQVFGIGIFCVAALTATMGISERAAWKHSCWTLKKELCGEQVISNILGLSIVLYVTSVVVIILNPRWRRRPLPEEESLHQLSSTE